MPGSDAVLQYRLIALDWDGTLASSLEHIVSSLRTAFKVASRRYPALRYPGDEAVRDVIGLGMSDVLQRLVGSPEPEGADCLLAAYRDAFFAVKPSREDLFPGVVETLEALRAEGYLLAIATGKSRRGMDMALDELGLRHLFHAVECADQSASKPDPLMLFRLMEQHGLDAGQMLMVGDTRYDLEMAQRAGVDALGVAYGAHSVKQLRAFPVMGILESFPDIVNYLGSR